MANIDIRTVDFRTANLDIETANFRTANIVIRTAHLKTVNLRTANRTVTLWNCFMRCIVTVEGGYASHYLPPGITHAA